MSLGDEDGYGNDAGRSSDAYSTIGGTRQTRTRLPDGPSGDAYGPRRPARNSRSLITFAGVVILLLGAIAFANMGGDNGSSDKPGTGSGDKAAAAPTAATGTKPVTTKSGTIPSGFAHDRQGAESAAANYAVALGSAEMFVASSRQAIVQATHDPGIVQKLTADLNAAYSPTFLKNVGLNEDGSAPAGLTFVSRTVPVGTTVVEQSADSATVEVWCTGLVGMAGEGSTKPVTETWFTITEKLKWVGNDWKIESSSQTEGPTPVSGDNRASSADEIAGAVEGYGGFVYAR
ncbi:hypothetical protein MHW47_18420 [Streptomyces sp. OfavH-34-F]|uniref:hypothetical protein n=1 Tax=Streptomyces sp. OfavH-34-F TaxID=2917760 RepID=UPI001EF1B2DE|nr:hypothetical protein [Streptomyces sp. OfavH-34-F]MCG7526414.1 hypothetical protein [Streptomyces sp. OfavH-34-F]